MLEGDGIGARPLAEQSVVLVEAQLAMRIVVDAADDIRVRPRRGDIGPAGAGGGHLLQGVVGEGGGWAEAQRGRGFALAAQQRREAGGGGNGEKVPAGQRLGHLCLERATRPPP